MAHIFIECCLPCMLETCIFLVGSACQACCLDVAIASCSASSFALEFPPSHLLTCCEGQGWCGRHCAGCGDEVEADMDAVEEEQDERRPLLPSNSNLKTESAVVVTTQPARQPSASTSTPLPLGPPPPYTERST
ncbi:hypothetical protein EXIGLDRAFT_245026 [Exidia glandulosa HHB12029]|uniref:4Fe-4S ferredoxin-type domain-containing protein n=1 Tax=Exidia glandulosa HHB12029 TaxID=1314781 RepID=A0A165Q9H3_EXIGL|nr:hypothetical protein EXIGLDRAFT_245026 [Exidia glandulosa HHB12029]